jgi:cell pole-organizing protein PopZ
MSNAKGAKDDPSMDDILASIRKIISDDEARSQVGASSPASAKRDDVLLLTDLVDEPEGMAPQSRPTPLPTARIDPAHASEMPQPAVEPMSSMSVTSPSPGEAPMKQRSTDLTLVEPGAANVTASAFERLSQAVQESVPAPAAHDPGPTVGAGGRNLEDIVKEMLQPMLKEWLDRNLPPMVERYVEREIVRLTRR